MHSKKSKLPLLVILPLLLAVWGIAYVFAAGPLIPDEQLEAAIRTEINYEKGEIRADQLSGIQSLRIRDANIESIEGLQHMTSLTSLDLRDNHISDISMLSGLTNLSDLNLRGNQISDINALENLTSLKNLNLRENFIEDISPLAGLYLLEDVNLRYNRIMNIEALRNLDSLRERLYLEGNPIVDFSPIEDYISEINDVDIDELNVSFEHIQNSLEAKHIFSHPGGFYNEEFQLELTSPYPDALIYFTLNGSQPDPINNPEHTFLFTETLTINDRTSEPTNLATIPTNYIDNHRGWNEPSPDIMKATVVRAVIKNIDHEVLNGVFTQSYFVNLEHSLPVISLSTNPEHFFDDESGIYVPGVHHNPEHQNADGTGNYYQRGREWERPIHVEYYEANGQLAFAQDAGVRIHGNFTRRFGQKSLRLYSRSDYGESRFRYQFFDTKEINNFNRLILRNSGNDWGMTMFRDAAMQSLIHHLPLDTQHYQPTVVFINGEYWGIHNVRDRFDRHYLETHYGGDRDQFTILDREGRLQDGLPSGQEHYEDLIDYAIHNNLGEESHYEHIKSLMDVNNYFQYYIVQIYNANTDWPHNNIRFWRYDNTDNVAGLANELDGRWRWMVFDVDRSLGYVDYDHNTVEWALGLLNPRHEVEWPNALFRSLLENESFTHQFINEFADHLNTTFYPDRVIRTIEQLKSTIEPEMNHHIDRWSIPTSFAAWIENVNEMKDFAIYRPAIVREHLAEHFGLDGTVQIKVVSDTTQGTIQINSIQLRTDTPGVDTPDRWAGKYFKGVPIKITATPNPGYQFVGWGDGNDAEAIEIVLNDDLELTPRFEPVQ